MPNIYYESDADRSLLEGKRVAVLGYGSQGRAHALNLHDSGVDVVVGLRPGGGSWTRAEDDGLAVAAPQDAAKDADLIAFLVPDPVQPAIYREAVEPTLSGRQTLLFAHGFNVHYGQITPPENVDVVMIAPKGPGNLVRKLYTEGQGVPCLLAVAQDASGKAKDTALAYGSALGGTRAGVLETSFQEEPETDLFGEQAVLCGGISSLMKAGFDTLVEAGYAPEMAYFECIHEMKLIVDLIYNGGLEHMRRFVSDTAKYGDVTRGPRVVEGGREHRTGQVVSVGPTDIFIEFGPKELGVLDRAQFKKGDTEEGVPSPGDQLEVVIQRYEASESLYICVLPGAVQKADWEMLTPGQIVEARVTGANKGGLELVIAQHRAFMPASQVDLDHVKDLSVFVGEKLECQVQRVDRRGKGNIVLSRREILQSQREEAAGKLKEALAEGQTITGTVRKIMDFGAFVDLGGVDGLIHISDLSHDRVNHGAKNVARHVSEGQQVTVQILKLDWEAGRISLGLKQLQSDPFEAAASEVVEGAELTGKVTKIADFGAFVEVAPGIEGLVHISELDYRRVAAVSDVVQEGEVVQVKVLKVDPDSRKISLSIKATKEPPQREGGGGRGKGRGGRGDRDDRSPEEIKKETPQLRRMREAAKKREKEQSKKGQGGLGESGGLGLGLGDLKL